MTENDTPAATEKATTCFVCAKEISDNHWFARIRHGTRRVIFAARNCVEKFLQPLEQACRGDWSG